MRSRSIQSGSTNNILNGRLTSDKFTFLKSNQLITKYVKDGIVYQNPISIKNGCEDSYIQCKQTLSNLEDKKMQCVQIANSAHQKIRRTLKEISQSKEKKQKDLEIQTNKIQFMAQDLITLAADVMLGRNVNTFNRQKTQKKSDMKKMGKSTLQKYLQKPSNTRKTMLIKSGKYRKVAQYRSKQNVTICNSNTSLLVDTTTSTISNSMIEDIIRQQKQKQLNSLKLRKKIENRGFQKVFESQRRAASCKAFGLFWHMNNQRQKNYQQIKKSKVPKEPKIGKKFKHQLFNQKQEVLKNDMSQCFKLQSRCMLQGSKKYAQKFNQRNFIEINCHEK